jgi:hypothetical protein
MGAHCALIAIKKQKHMEEKKPLDAVYILGSSSRWRNNEIRYSLRSVEQNLEIGKVFIIGACPDWVTGVTHIPANDLHKNKLLNAREKYAIAAKDLRISKDFILMNDDFFILKPVEKIENYIRGTIADMIAKHPTKGGYYYHSLSDTKKVMEAIGIDNPLDFEIHAPIIFNKDKLLTVMEMIQPDKAYSLRSCYGNMNGLKGKKVIDFKASGLVDFAYQMKRDPAYLSINDNMVAQKEFRDWIRRKFPKPSKYETDRGDGTDVLPGQPMCAMRYYAKKTFIYFGKTYSTGEIIDMDVVEEIKYNPQMAEVWELK